LSEWRIDAIVIGGFAETSGKKPERPMARTFRFDLAFAQGLIFPNLDESILISRWSAALPFHNLYVPRERQDPNNREYYGVSGVHMVDNTTKRLVLFYDVQLLTTVVVCGCFVRYSTSFPNSYVPLTIVERVTRVHPVVFSDSTDGTETIVVSVGGSPIYLIDPTKRDNYKGVSWIGLQFISR
jgi:hypothetical protein